MTSTPDQFPAATEVGKVPATDPGDKASEVESEQDPGPDDDAGTSAPGNGAESEQADAAGDAEEPAGGIIESVPSAEAAASADGDEAESETDEPEADEAEAGDAAELARTAPVDAEPEVATEASAEKVADEPEGAPEPAKAKAEPVETVSGLPRRPKRDETPTEEISIVPAPEPAAKPGQAPEAAADDDADTEPATTKSAATSTPSAPTPSGSTTPPVVDETFDFKALSFAAISAAHKKALGPRTIVGEVETTGEPTAGEPTPGEQTTEGEAAAQAPAEATAAADASAPAETAEEAADGTEAPAAATELFASPTTHTPPAPAPPSPFPTPAAPAQHQPGAPAQAQPTAPQQPPSPFPASPGGSAHGFPAVHDYAPEASYVGWRPPTPEDESAKRRRFALIGGAVVALIAVVAVVAIIVNLVNRQQWEPIEAMIAEPQEVHPLQLVLGSCVESVPDDGEVSEVLAVPCDASHAAQVVGRTDFADAAVWPGRDEVDKRVALVCGTKQLGPVARTSPLADSVRYVVWGPSEDSWDDGDRVGLCLATTAEPITQDLLQ